MPLQLVYRVEPDEPQGEKTMVKVTMIGAGSVVFSRSLSNDILSFPELRNATLTYMDIDPDRLKVGAELCRRSAKAFGANPRIEATQDRREALRDADFVINMVQVGGVNATVADFEIPRKYGLRFTVADTTGPGALFRALRTFPMLQGLCQDIMELCPKAWMLNYANPLSMNMQTVYRTSGIKGVGLCHGVQGTFHELAYRLNEDPADLAFICAGINHMGFFIRLEKDGVDLYPRLFEAMKAGDNPIGYELMKRLGYFPAVPVHHAEYSPYFIPHGREVLNQFAIPLDVYLKTVGDGLDEFARMKAIARGEAEDPAQPHRSAEYGGLIIHSVATGEPSVVYGNMPNLGAVSNLPATAIIEAPTLVDRSGLKFAMVGELPPQIVGYLQPHITQHELFIRAAIEGRRDYVYQAAIMDPLTSAVLTLDNIVAMCDELIAVHGDALPDLDTKKTLVPGSDRKIEKTDLKTLRRQWEDDRTVVRDSAVKAWHVVGPFMSPNPGEISLDMATAVDKDFERRGDGTVDLAATYRDTGRTLKWTQAASNERDSQLDCDKVLGHYEYCLAYGYGSVESPTEREVVLLMGSDDGMRVWLNGKEIHRIECMRGYSLTSDEVRVRLRAGTNHLLVKLSQLAGAWGFGISAVAPKYASRG
jgi:alpha-galactosidase